MWGEDPPLEKLYLDNCSILEDHCSTILQSLHTCIHLKVLSMDGNGVGTAGNILAKSIKMWGEDPPLEKLYLDNCSIPEDHCSTILQSLHSCIHLTDLSMTGNNVGATGRFLAESIKQLGSNPPLQTLRLRRCSLGQEVCGEIFISLQTCKNLTQIIFSGNKVGRSGLELAQTIRQWGDNPPLQRLSLHGCSIPEEACCELTSALFSCKRLTILELTGNYLCKNGLHLKRYLETITDRLEVLSLAECSVPVDVSGQILSLLSQCKKLYHLSVPGKVTGVLSNSIPNPPLKFLFLSNTDVNKQDLNHLTGLFQSNKLPNLEKLSLFGNSLDQMVNDTEKLLERCVKCHKRELTINLGGNNLSVEFKNCWNTKCKDTKITLVF